MATPEDNIERVTARRSNSDANPFVMPHQVDVGSSGSDGEDESFNLSTSSSVLAPDLLHASPGLDDPDVNQVSQLGTSPGGSSHMLNLRRQTPSASHVLETETGLSNKKATTLTKAPTETGREQENFLQATNGTTPHFLAKDDTELEPSFSRLRISGQDIPLQDELAQCEHVAEALEMRRRFVYRRSKPLNPPKPQENPPFDLFNADNVPGPSDHEWQMTPESLFRVYANVEDMKLSKVLYDSPTLKEYYRTLDRLLAFVTDGPTKTFCFKRLKILDAKYKLHKLVNSDREIEVQKSVPHRDFYNVRKVDTHVHLASAMNHKHLLRFIKNKLKECPNEIVIERDGQTLTLSQVFESLRLTAYDLSVDTLDVHADAKTFHRFDRFNRKYSPVGESRLREIFMKTDNKIKGRYFAELVREVAEDLNDSKYQHAEYRVSIYGKNINEWDKLADWVVNNKLGWRNVRWLIQVPRLYSTFMKNRVAGLTSFDDLLRNIFTPLFEVTKDPSSHPNLHLFLQQVVGVDCVDDESVAEIRVHRKFPYPRQWKFNDNPPYSYYLFYLYANMNTLNKFREEKGYTTFEFRPHSGEAGDVFHLATTFLLANSINHGLQLRHAPVLQYLYYLDRIGLAMSPLGNNCLFLEYQKNPFPTYFARGLNVSLSTDDPLQFHYTREPLMEEYSVAAQVYKLSSADICEIADNSIRQSGFEDSVKRLWLGEDYNREGVFGNSIHRSNVPSTRVAYRQETWATELQLILNGLKARQSAERFPYVKALLDRALSGTPRQFVVDMNRESDGPRAK